MKINKLTLAMLTLILIATNYASVAAAQTPEAETLTLLPAMAYSDSDVTLRVDITLADDLHLYGPKVQDPYFATNVIITKAGPIDWQKEAIYPAVKSISIFDETISVIEPDPKTNTVSIIFKGKVKPNTAVGEYTIEAKLTYQACSESACHSPIRNKPIALKFKVLDLSDQQTIATLPVSTKATIDTKPITTTKTSDSTTTTTSENDKIIADPPKDEASRKNDGLGTTVSFFSYKFDLSRAGLWRPLLIAFLAGLILNIMPCVLPVIPLKVLQLTKQAHQTHHSPFRLSLTFALGIISFFMSIAVLALILKGGFSWGQTFQHSSALIILSLILVVLALGMFDVYQIRIPQFIASRSFVKGGELGAYSMGFLAGILSTPCSFGILGAAVAWAQSRSAWITIIGFLAIGVGMACPYVILSSFPKLINKIPKAGRWSELFKQGMGFLLLGVAVFLITALPKDQLLGSMLYIILFSFVIWFWGEALEYKRTQCSVVCRICAAVVLIVGGWLLLGSPEAPIQWQPLTKANFQLIQDSDKDVVVEFTADWCINCRTVEYLVFNNKDVKNSLRAHDVLMLQGDMTQGDLYVKNLLKELTGTDAPPFTVVFKTDGRRILLPGIYSADDLLEAIDTKQ